ncbi:MAG: poly-gamma-glutamate hydrolase family protein [Methylococcales bacterium]
MKQEFNPTGFRARRLDPMDRYRNFAQLKNHEVESQDYRIRVREGDSGTVILAPHGGRIERGTSQIAQAIVGDEHTFYAFEGLKPGLKSNRALHITSNHFDEPIALAIVTRAERVIAIHGAKGMEAAIYLGGLELDLRAQLLESCRSKGFTACDDPSPTRQGNGANNICNRGQSGRGVQVEVTFGLRKRMFDRSARGTKWEQNRVFDRVVLCFSDVL